MPHRYQERLDFFVDTALDFTRSDHDLIYTVLEAETYQALDAVQDGIRVEVADRLKRMLYAAQNPNVSLQERIHQPDKRRANAKNTTLRARALKDGVAGSLKQVAEYKVISDVVSKEFQALPMFAQLKYAELPKTDIDQNSARHVFQALAMMAHPDSKTATRKGADISIKMAAIKAFGEAYQYLDILGYGECAKPYDAVIHMYCVDPKLHRHLRSAACNAFRKPTLDIVQSIKKRTILNARIAAMEAKVKPRGQEPIQLYAGKGVANTRLAALGILG